MIQHRYKSISVYEIRPGVVSVVINTRAYGQAGAHWKSVLEGPRQGGYGRIYIQRHEARQRRREACWELRGMYSGCAGANLDECPGAMFIWTGQRLAHVEAIDAMDNQSLGRDLGIALRPCVQNSPDEWWEVEFRFL